MLQIHNIRINLQGKGGHIYKKGVYLNQWARDRPSIQTTSQRIQMAKARTLTFTFPDGKIRKVRTARNYSHAVKATFRVQSKFAYNGKYYLATEKHLCGRPDLMEKCVAKYSSLEGAEIMVAPLTNDPWANN